MLEKNGIILDYSINERDIVKSTYEGHIYNPNILTFTILPIEACNFNCPYCFLYEKTNEIMNEETKENIIKFMKKFFTNKVVDSDLVINWFGGEPTLYYFK